MPSQMANEVGDVTARFALQQVVRSELLPSTEAYSTQLCLCSLHRRGATCAVLMSIVGCKKGRDTCVAALELTHSFRNLGCCDLPSVDRTWTCSLSPYHMAPRHHGFVWISLYTFAHDRWVSSRARNHESRNWRSPRKRSFHNFRKRQ